MLHTTHPRSCLLKTMSCSKLPWITPAFKLANPNYKMYMGSCNGWHQRHCCSRCMNQIWSARKFTLKAYIMRKREPRMVPAGPQLGTGTASHNQHLRMGWHGFTQLMDSLFRTAGQSTASMRHRYATYRWMSKALEQLGWTQCQSHIPGTLTVLSEISHLNFILAIREASACISCTI